MSIANYLVAPRAHVLGSCCAVCVISRARDCAGHGPGAGPGAGPGTVVLPGVTPGFPTHTANEGTGHSPREHSRTT